MKVHVLYKETNGDVLGWATSPISNDNHSTLEIDINNEQFFKNFIGFKIIDNELVFDAAILLQNEKQLKIAELREQCQKTIEAGFYYEMNELEYHFSFDSEAQQNFQTAIFWANENIISGIGWTVKLDNEYKRIYLTKEDLNGLSMKILSHKQSNIEKFRDFLTPIVEAAATESELNEINW